jgi:predicted enzyme related to lactoylglutathione lyase
VVKGLTYVILTTQDMQRARDFFTEKLGIGREEEQGDIFSQFATREGTGWALLQARPNNEPKEVELYLRVEDVDRTYQEWKQRGVELLTEPHDEEFGRTFALRDPDGRTLHAYA